MAEKEAKENLNLRPWMDFLDYEILTLLLMYPWDDGQPNIFLGEGDSIYYVNTQEPSRLVHEILRHRNSTENCIIGKEGDFDTFICKLARCIGV